MPVAFLCAAALAAASAEPLVIAERGKEPSCCVAVPAKASVCLAHAAAELTNYVARMTGVALPVVRGEAGGRHVRLRVEPTLPKASLRFRREGACFLMEGASEREVLFAVYDYLENQCGCDWFAPGQELVPTVDRLAVAGDYAPRLRKPAFESRENTHYDIFMDRDFAAKLKLNGYIHGVRSLPQHGGDVACAFDDWLGKCHTFMKLLPPEKYYGGHPEYFALVKGERKRSRRMNLCLTNPEVVKIVTENVLRRIDRVRAKRPNRRIFGVSQSDCWEPCECENCRAVDAREGSAAGSNIAFVNRVADAVKAKHPDVLIATLAYEYTRQPPKTIRPRDNVMVVLCTDTCDFSKPMKGNRYHYRGSGDFLDDLAAWCRICRHVHIWDYTMNFQYKLHSFPNVYAMKANFESFRDAGVREVFEQGPGGSRHQAGVALKQYVTPRLLWDPSVPLEELFDRFYPGYYGAAAPWMRKYMEELHRMSMDRDEAKTPMMMWGTLTSPALKTAFYERGAEWLARAAEAVKDDPVRLRNVQWEQNANDYTRIMRADLASLDPARRAEYARAARRILADWSACPESANVSEVASVRAKAWAKMRAAAGLFRCYAGCLAGGKGGDSIHVVDCDAQALSVSNAYTLTGYRGTSYLQLDANRQNLYAFISEHTNDGALVKFALAPDGRPGRMTRVKNLPGVRPCHIALSPDGSRLAFAAYGSATCGVVGTDGSGLKTYVFPSDAMGCNALRQKKAYAHCAFFAPDGRRVGFTDLGCDRIRFFETETMAEVKAMEIAFDSGDGPRHALFSKNGRFLYVVNELSSTVAAFAFDGRSFRRVAKVSTLPEGFARFAPDGKTLATKAAAIRMSADGRLLMASNRGCDSIAFFDVSAKTGVPALRRIAPLAGPFPRDFTLLPGEEFMLVGHKMKDEIRLYRFDRATCGLEPVGRPVAAYRPCCFLPLD